MIFLPISKKRAIELSSKYPDLTQEVAAPDGRRFTSVAIHPANLKLAQGNPELDRALPWRYRATPIAVRLTGTPLKAPSELLAKALSNHTYGLLTGRVNGHYGGRCQVCGASHQNAAGRRTAPRILPVWIYLPHANPAVKRGMRELIGITAVCDRCQCMFSLADATPCSHLSKDKRQAAFQQGIRDLADHNRWPIEKVYDAIRAHRFNRKRWDNVTWASDIRWLIEKRLLRPGEIQLGLRAIHQDYRLFKKTVILDATFKSGQRS